MINAHRPLPSQNYLGYKSPMQSLFVDGPLNTCLLHRLQLRTPLFQNLPKSVPVFTAA